MASLLQSASAVHSGFPREASEQAGTPAGPSVYVMPATQGQVRFWSLDQLQPGNPGLNMPLMWQCTGPLNSAALREAFQQCVERHEMLRTTFALADGRLSQIIHSDTAVDLPVIDLSDLHGEAQRADADRLTRKHATTRMDLQRGPLLLLQLLRFSAERHLLLVNMHHIICDGISLGILMRDMLAFYETAVQGSELRLPDLPIQFGDYAVWQDEWRHSAEADASREFWHETLGSHFRNVVLPRDTPEPSKHSVTTASSAGAGDIETLLLPRDLATRAHAFCLRENVTFNMLLFSVFVAMIARLTGELEFTIGSPCANRTEDTEELIGLFMNIQLFRAQLQKSSTFADLLQQVKTWTLGAYENQTFPFEDLLHDPFFAEGAGSFQIPVFFLYQKSFMVTRRIGQMEIVPLRSESPGAVFDMMFAIVDRESEGPRLQLEFDPRKHATSTIQRWLRLYLDLLELGISVADTELQRLGTVSPEDQPGLRKDSIATEIAGADVSGAHKHQSEQPAFLPPRDVVERQLAEMWQTALSIPRIGVRTNFFSLGVSSLAALRLVTRMNRIYATDLGLATLLSAPTIEALSEVIRNRLSPNTSSTVVPLKASGSKAPLFLVHGVGGNIISFHGLAMRLGDDQPVYGIQAQSLLHGQPGLLRLEDMATAYVDAVRKIQPQGPYHFLGYSFGGTVAMEMAHQLREAGQQVALLSMLDSKSKLYWNELARQAPVQARALRRVQRFRGNAGHLDTQGRIRYISDKVFTRAARYVYRASAAIGLRKLPAFLKSAEDLNRVAINNYVVRPYEGSMVLFRAAEQHDGAEARSQEGGTRPDFGWSSYFTQGVSICELPGDHERVFLEPMVETLAQRLRDILSGQEANERTS